LSLLPTLLVGLGGCGQTQPAAQTTSAVSQASPAPTPAALLASATSLPATVFLEVPAATATPGATTESPLSATGGSPLAAPMIVGNEAQVVVVHTNSVSGYVDPCG